MYLKNNIIETFYIESLGCPKNSVDSRSIAELLMAAGKKEVEDPQQADLILVNTCGFIQPAVDESLSVLNEFAGSKRADQILIAAGCLSEREKANLFDQVPNLDAAFGTRRWAEVLRLVGDIEKGRRNRYAYFPQSSRIMDDPPGIIRAANMGGSAYLKTADVLFALFLLLKGHW
jgi:ribosomal protein S12 methylthiotransferase